MTAIISTRASGTTETIGLREAIIIKRTYIDINGFSWCYTSYFWVYYSSFMKNIIEKYIILIKILDYSHSSTTATISTRASGTTETIGLRETIIIKRTYIDINDFLW